MRGGDSKEPSKKKQQMKDLKDSNKDFNYYPLQEWQSLESLSLTKFNSLVKQKINNLQRKIIESRAFARCPSQCLTYNLKNNKHERK